jgi:DNA polymerase III subunit delta'
MPFRDLIGHEHAKALLRAAIQTDRLAHAYLFHGDAAIGKRSLAVLFAQAINCETEGPEPDACGMCRSCNQILARTHPDCLYIEPDPELATPQIKIDQIRQIEQQIIYRPLMAHRKVCVIDDADCMTLSAANALLKTLEEPPDHTLFVLMSSRPLALLPTIWSRCQSIRFAPPPRAEVEAALIARRKLPAADARFLTMLTQARIGQALGMDVQEARARQLEFAELTSQQTLRSVAGLLAIAEALAKSDQAPDALEWLSQWLRDVILVQIGADQDLLLNSDRLAELRDVAQRLAPDAVIDLQSRIGTLQRAANRNLNPQLALENILIGLREASLAPG